MATKPTGAAEPAVQKEEYQQTHAIPLTESGVAQAVDVDAEFQSDADSFYSSAGGSETTSVTPSVFNYVYENGRRYASDRFRKADYFLPNDDHEQNRLDLYHHIFLMVTGGRLYTAPLDNPQEVLDLGTGTGIWAIDFAHENEQSKVIGVDISPIQPELVPLNCQFEVDDIEDQWTYHKDHFDYIHMRSLSGSIEDWGQLLRQIYQHLKPDGIVEFQDYGCEAFFHTGKPILGTKTPLDNWLREIVEGAEILRRPLPMGRRMKALMQAAGFADVHEQTGIWPIGDWPKDKGLKQLGRWSTQGMLESLEPFAVQILSKTKGYSIKEVKELCDPVRADLAKQSPNKYYFQAWFTWGRKPYDGKSKHE